MRGVSLKNTPHLQPSALNSRPCDTPRMAAFAMGSLRTFPTAPTAAAMVADPIIALAYTPTLQLRAWYASGMIVAQALADQDTDDPSQVAPLLDQIDDPIGQVTADGAYDGTPTYQTIAQHGDGIEVVIPPRSTSIPSGEPGPPTQRDRHLAMIAEQGRLAWQATTGYGQRSLVETTMGRYKSLIGPRLRARGFAGQQTEAAVGVAVLNRMMAAGRPDSVRRQPVTA